MPPSEHFSQAPHWEWWILAYFVFGGISGGSYAIGTLIRIFGAPADQRISRVAYIVSFLALIPCPIFLIVDLGQPVRFLNLLLNMSDGGPMFKPEVPLSVGVWALPMFGLFSFVSFLGALAEGGTRAVAAFRGFVSGTLGSVWGIIGTALGLFIAGYTGVLLSVSNQAVWSDAGWVLGGLFVASALTGSAMVLLALVHWRHVAEEGTAVRLEMADRDDPRCPVRRLRRDRRYDRQAPRHLAPPVDPRGARPRDAARAIALRRRAPLARADGAGHRAARHGRAPRAHHLRPAALSRAS
jgi:formate-dependent nitrite reductase membrane component NrfD